MNKEKNIHRKNLKVKRLATSKSAKKLWWGPAAVGVGWTTQYIAKCSTWSCRQLLGKHTSSYYTTSTCPHHNVLIILLTWASETALLLHKTSFHHCSSVNSPSRYFNNNKNSTTVAHITTPSTDGRSIKKKKLTNTLTLTTPSMRRRRPTSVHLFQTPIIFYIKNSHAWWGTKTSHMYNTIPSPRESQKYLSSANKTCFKAGIYHIIWWNKSIIQPPTLKGYFSSNVMLFLSHWQIITTTVL